MVAVRLIPIRRFQSLMFFYQGRGIMHAEMPVHAKDQPDPIGLQLWVNLPAKYKMVEPSYQELTAANIPTAYPHGKDGGVSLKVISGKSHGVESPVRPLGGCWYLHWKFTKKDVSVFQDIRMSHSSHDHST